MSSTTSSVTGARIASMEGLRAYAVLLVFLVHFVGHYFHRVKAIDFDRFSMATASTMVDGLAYYMWASHYGVDLFFLLSGFLIFRLVARADFRFGRFLWHRLARLYPAFAVALLLHIAYHAVFWGQFYDGRTLLQNALFLQGIFELRIPGIIVPGWSLSFEWLFYLTTPVLLMLLAGRNSPIRIWHVAVAGAFTLVALLPVGAHYARFVMFFAGALLAAAPSEKVMALVRRVPGPVVVLAYMAVTLSFAFNQNYYYFAWPYSIACLLLVAKSIYGAGTLSRIFQLNVLRRLGNISYSFYLLHGLVLIAVVDHLGPVLTWLPALMHFAVLLAVSFAVSTAVSVASYRLLERPYFERRQQGQPAPVGAHAAAVPPAVHPTRGEWLRQSAGR